MAFESGFFNSVGGDRLYNAEQMSRYFENILSSGIFKRIDNCLRVSAAGGMTLTVAPGAGLIDCHWFRARTAETVTISAAHAVLPRFDIICARLDMSDQVRAITLEVVSGAPAENPVAPDPIRTATMYDLVLALVYVPAGAAAITVENLTDVRDNDWYCGYVQSLVDTPILKTFHYRYTAAANDTTVAPIGISGFNAGVDLLTVYINGFRLAPVAEYTINPTTNSITLAEPVDAGTVFDFEVFRPAMPDDVPGVADVIANVVQDMADMQTRITELEADSGWQELPWENGVNSNANWTARIRRVGKSIFLRGLCSGVTANELQVCTVPEAFRPTMGGHAYSSFCSTNTGTNTRAARMFINTDGGVVFRSAGNAVPASTDVVTITTSWLID